MSYLLTYSNWKKINEAANGNISSADLTEIPLPSTQSDDHVLNKIAADAYSDMVTAAKNDGISWEVSDSYRPLEVQKKLAIEKGLYSQGGLAAEPGKSNHGWGSAVDLKIGRFSKEFEAKDPMFNDLHLKIKEVENKFEPALLEYIHKE